MNLKKNKQKITLWVGMFVIEILLLVFLYNMVGQIFSVALFADAYYSADCEEIVVVYNNYKNIACDEFTHAKTGYVLELNTEELLGVEYLSICFPVVDRNIGVYAVGLRLFGITVKELYMEDNSTIVSPTDGTLWYAIPSSIIEQVKEFYSAYRFFVLGIGSICVIVAFNYLFSISDKICEKYIQRPKKTEKQLWKFDVLHLYNALFPVIVIARGYLLFSKGINIRFYCEKPEGIREIIIFVLGFVLWMFVKRYLENDNRNIMCQTESGWRKKK